MKVYLETFSDSLALARVRQALVTYKPRKVIVTDNEREADLVIIHINGRRDAVERRIMEIRRRNKEYAVIQYALRSTQKPKTGDWSQIWTRARLVWSYYDLPRLCGEDGPFWSKDDSFKFYHAPLGVDSRIFKPQRVSGTGKYIVAAVGRDWLTESVRECVLAARAVDRTACYIGPEINRAGFSQARDVSDLLIAQLYSFSNYVSGLRRIEGFELPAAEGLLCGARPILFDRSHYRQWYGMWAEYIPEAPRQEVVDSLVALFSAPPRPVTPAERKDAREVFNWHDIISGFWRACL